MPRGLQPQPLFPQGTPARIRLLIAVGLAVATMQADHRFQLAQPLRQGVSTILFPLTELLRMPRDATQLAQDFFWSLRGEQAELNELRRLEVINAAALLQSDQLRAENASLRTLLGLRQNLGPQSIPAEIRAAQLDPLAHRVIINRGQEHGVSVGDPVITSAGIIGQVFRAFPLSSEVKLIIDPSFSMPVALPGAGIQAVTRGLGKTDNFELQYVNLEANVQVGDKILSSGLDGLYPAGLPVGVVVRVVEPRLGKFPQVLAQPVASVAIQKQVLVLRHGTPASP